MRRLIVTALALLALGLPVTASAGTKPAGDSTIPTVLKPTGPTKKATKSLWSCGTRFGNLGAGNIVCSEMATRWHNWEKEYMHGTYLFWSGAWYHHHRDWECWFNTAWTNAALFTRCSVTTFWIGQPGNVKYFLHTQMNVFKDYSSSQLPANCGNNPGPWNAFAPANPLGHITVNWAGQAPPYTCYSMARLSGDFDELGSW